MSIFTSDKRMLSKVSEFEFPRAPGAAPVPVQEVVQEQCFRIDEVQEVAQREVAVMQEVEWVPPTAGREGPKRQGMNGRSRGCVCVGGRVCMCGWVGGWILPGSRTGLFYVFFRNFFGRMDREDHRACIFQFNM